jgi:hypothetical protein
MQTCVQSHQPSTLQSRPQLEMTPHGRVDDFTLSDFDSSLALDTIQWDEDRYADPGELRGNYILYSI